MIVQGSDRKPPQRASVKAAKSGKDLRFDRGGNDCIFRCLAWYVEATGLKAASSRRVERERIRQWPAVTEVIQCLVGSMNEFGVTVAYPHRNRRGPLRYQRSAWFDRHVASPIRDDIALTRRPSPGHRTEIERRSSRSSSSFLITCRRCKGSGDPYFSERLRSMRISSKRRLRSASSTVGK